jgi:hypothetical protein
VQNQKENKMKTKSTILFTLFVLVMAGLTMSASSNSNTATLRPVTPREEATVSFSFDGLMAICFGNPARVSAGLLDVHHHTPELTITRVKGENRSTMAVLKGEQLRGVFYVDVEGNTKTGVSRYYAESMNDPNDFRWNVDLEGDLHQRQLYVKEEKLFGKIHFNSGLFYAENLSEETVRFFAADNSGKLLPFNRKVAAPAAKVNLMQGEALVIRGAKDQIRLVAEPGVRYEVTVNNLPPADMANMDHWLYYYDVIGTKVTPYQPVMTKKAVLSPRPLLCIPALFTRSQLD